VAKARNEVKFLKFLFCTYCFWWCIACILVSFVDIVLSVWINFLLSLGWVILRWGEGFPCGLSVGSCLLGRVVTCSAIINFIHYVQERRSISVITRKIGN
jgi:hypothetical protein